MGYSLSHFFVKESLGSAMLRKGSRDYITIYYHQEKLRENKKLSTVYKKIVQQWNRGL